MFSLFEAQPLGVMIVLFAERSSGRIRNTLAANRLFLTSPQGKTAKLSEHPDHGRVCSAVKHQY
jgi:hypothetical protein